MLLQLFTAGVLWASAYMAWAFKTPGTVEARVMSKVSAVRLRGDLSVAAGAFGSVIGGVFASGHAFPCLASDSHFARVENARRVLARLSSDKTSLGFIGYPAYLR